MNGSCLRKVTTTGKKSLAWLSNTIQTKRTEDSPKEIQKAKGLDHDANEGPFEKNEQNPAEETNRTPQFIFPSKEVKSLLRPNDQSQA